ncbi:sugar O-acetyltransferase [Fundicoccus culcitae]|uniref:Acetyltransferase n=1 Tax=Fundicoccus culcitae TaxID=2969821 RepID=A0ABY5P7R1_9LACT|nr:sugar O-acetyltransferase [Fundicoccus culcitae]UUX34763.1 sugar O-acetyltransferase [Fundicoccus culcitae]
MDIFDKMKSGEIYNPGEADLLEMQVKANQLIFDYNHTPLTERGKRQTLIKEIFASVGENITIETPFHANWGLNTSLGSNFYANFNMTLVDDADITIGDLVKFGPNVVLTTASHPIDPDLRRQSLQFNRPIVIGDNVWIGANVVVFGGVSIGENSVIGAGSVVTKDVPANVVAFGNPCKVIRPVDA